MTQVPWIVLGVAAGAAGWVTAAVAARSNAEEVRRLQTQLEGTRRQGQALQAEAASLRAHRCPAPAPPPAEPPAAPPASAAAPPAPAAAPAPAVPIPPPGTPDETARLQFRALDPAETPERRVAALRELRRVEGGRTRAVAESLLGLLDTAADPSLRADICRQLHRAVPPDLKGPLLRRLRADADARVREEAAETLGPLKEDPEVRAALEDAARSDAEEKVRSQAARSLSGRR